MNQIKTLLIDVDGTFLRSDRSISQVVLAAIFKARKAGIMVGVCTGRQLPTLNLVFASLGTTGFHVISGGAQVYDAAKNDFIWDKQIASAEVKWLYQQITSLGGQVILGKKEVMYGEQGYLDHVKRKARGYKANLITNLGDDWSTPLISVSNLSSELIDFLDHQDKVMATHIFKNTPSAYYDLTPMGVTKINGIKRLAEHLKIELNQIAGIGDGENDQQFLAHIGWPIAMGNAAQVIKQVAKNVVASNDEDGVAEAIDLILN